MQINLFDRSLQLVKMILTHVPSLLVTFFTKRSNFGKWITQNCIIAGLIGYYLYRKPHHIACCPLSISLYFDRRRNNWTAKNSPKIILGSKHPFELQAFIRATDVPKRGVSEEAALHKILVANKAEKDTLFGVNWKVKRLC